MHFSFQHWDMDDCRCECTSHPTLCPVNMLWDPDTCQCECVQSMKDSCTDRNMLIDRQTCQCYCSPDIPCPGDTSPHPAYDCNCV